MWKRLLPYLIAAVLLVLSTIRLYDRGDTLGVILNGLTALAVIVGLTMQFIRRRKS